MYPWKGNMSRFAGLSNRYGLMHVVACDCRQVGLQAIRDKDGTRFDAFEQERAQGCALGVRDNAKTTPAKPFGLEDLHGYSHERLTGGTTPSLAGPGTTQEGFVDLNRSGEVVPASRTIAERKR